MTAMLILGVDPGLNKCGWGLVASEGSRLSHVAHGVIKPSQAQQLASRLHDVFEGLSEVIERYQPHEAAVEETFVNSNARAALVLGQARGVALAAAARRGLIVAEYAPATIKKQALDDAETLTYLHGTISTKRHPVAVPETPMYLDAVLVDEPLLGGLEPMLGDQHVRVLSIKGFPNLTRPGLLDELNDLHVPYR